MRRLGVCVSQLPLLTPSVRGAESGAGAVAEAGTAWESGSGGNGRSVAVEPESEARRRATARTLGDGSIAAISSTRLRAAVDVIRANPSSDRLRTEGSASSERWRSHDSGSIDAALPSAGLNPIAASRSTADARARGSS